VPIFINASHFNHNSYLLILKIIANHDDRYPEMSSKFCRRVAILLMYEITHNHYTIYERIFTLSLTVNTPIFCFHIFSFQHFPLPKGKKDKIQKVFYPHGAEAEIRIAAVQPAVVPVRTAYEPRGVTPTAAADHPIRPAPKEMDCDVDVSCMPLDHTDLHTIPRHCQQVIQTKALG